MKMKLISLLLVALVISITPVFAVQLNLSYDANGNKVAGDDGFYHVYNSLNQLWRVYNGSLAGNLVQEYTYHPNEERVWTKKTFYTNGSLQEEVIYFTKSHVRVVNSSGTFDTRYVYDDGQLVAQKSQNTTLFIVGDNIGSATVVTNSTGGVVEKNTYAPFGQQLSNSIVRYGYEAKEQDTVLGDTDFNFRKYYSKTNLFTKPDTIIPSVYNPQDLNRYSFENNNPYNQADPSGHCPLCVTAGIGAIIGAIAGGVGSAAIQYTTTGTVNWKSVGKSAVVGAAAGAVAGLTLGLGSAAVGAATVAGGGAGTVGGTIAGASASILLGGTASVLAGQTGRATQNIITGQNVLSGLGNPSQMGTDFAIGGVTGGIAYGVSSIVQSASSVSRSGYTFPKYASQLTNDLGVEPTAVGSAGRLKWIPNENTRIFFDPGHEIPAGGSYTPYEQGSHYSVMVRSADMTSWNYVTNPNNPNSFGRYNYIPGDTIS